ncbi:hypothetical protein HKX48_000010 [Thoreauomyces humboldtii]|nr:hypothetical protein HKX48_000010 [Thoreauomyces humboldtii]
MGRFDSWKSDGPTFFDKTHKVRDGKVHFQARRRESYYFVFYMSSAREHASGTADFEVEARTYSILDPIYHCPANVMSLCTVPVVRNETSFLLFVAPPEEDAYAVTIQTRARWNLYLDVLAVNASVAVLLLVGKGLARRRCFRGFRSGAAARRRVDPLLADESGLGANASQEAAFVPDDDAKPTMMTAHAANSRAPDTPAPPPPYSVEVTSHYVHALFPA